MQYLAIGGSAVLELGCRAFAFVETEAQLDHALGAGYSIIFRGMVPITTAKWIRHPGTVMTSLDGAGGIIASLNPASAATPRAFTVVAPDVTICRMKLTSTVPVATTTAYAINLGEGVDELCHRLTLEDLEIWNWARCVSKDGGASSPYQDDVRITRCYLHTFSGHGLHPNFGMRRLRVRDTKIEGRVGGASHTTWNAVYAGSNWIDCVLEDCWFGNVTRMGCELTNGGYINAGVNQLRTKLVRCIAENCQSYGFSSGFCKGVLFDTCTAKDVQGVGFELAGRHPLYVPQGGEPATPADAYGQGSLLGCIVDGVTGPASGATGFSIDGAFDVNVSGPTQISNISSTFAPISSYGIQVHSCERVTVRGATIRIYGGRGINIRRLNATNASGFHVIEGNAFYNKAGDSERVGVYIEDTTATVRQNINWAVAGTVMNNQANTAAPAKVYVDGVAVPAGSQYLAGSNLTVPA